MAVEQDYLVRAIKEMAKVIAKVILKKTDTEYRVSEQAESTEDALYVQLMKMLDEGEVNEAENLLFEELDGKDKNKLEVALAFYTKLAEYEEDYLKEHNYSKEEVKNGLIDIAKIYGVVNVINYLELD